MEELEMSLDAKRGNLIKKSLENVGFTVKNVPLAGDSYRLQLEEYQGKKLAIEIYKSKNDPHIVFSFSMYMNKEEHLKYSSLSEEEKTKFKNDLKKDIQTMNLSGHEIIDNQEGFGVWIYTAIDQNSLDSAELNFHLGNIVDSKNILNDCLIKAIKKISDKQ